MNSRMLGYYGRTKAHWSDKWISPKEANWTKAFFEIYPGLTLAERQAHAFAYALENEPVYVYPDELIAGHIYYQMEGSNIAVYASGSATDERWSQYAVDPVAQREIPADPMFDTYQFASRAAFSGHVTWDYGMILDHGVEGMLEDVAQLQKKTEDEKAREFYEGVEISLKGLLNWTAKHVNALRQAAAEETDPARSKELLEMAEICGRVPAQPASTFREAVQSFYLQYLAVMFETPNGGMGPGRLDYYLWHFLEADLRECRITREDAFNLIVELFIKLDERIHNWDGWVEAIVVGGVNPDGSSGVNPLSHIIVEAIMELNITHPSVYVRLPSNAPRDFVDLCARYVIDGSNRCQIHGDDATITALVNDGVKPEDAAMWAAGGCMEVGMQGLSGDMLWCFIHNVARTFELIINGGKLMLTGEQAIASARELGEYESFEDLYNAFETELDREITIRMQRTDVFARAYAKYRPAFLLSSMIHDCLERGRNLLDGGARYPDYGGSGLGIPNVGDCLYSIKRAVFDEKRYTGQEILEALRVNFEGHEEMLAYLRAIPKYGSGNQEAAAMVDRALMSFTNTLKNFKNPMGGHGRPVILGFIWVVEFGKEVGATPDGRLAGRPLAQSMSPQCGSATNGVTTAINDATSLSLDQVSGGASMMWDIDSSWAKPEFVRPVMESFVELGGQVFQGNVISIEKLREAQVNPAEHADLIVRVGGFSARFTTLDKSFQEEIINRHKYSGN